MSRIEIQSLPSKFTVNLKLTGLSSTCSLEQYGFKVDNGRDFRFYSSYNIIEEMVGKLCKAANWQPGGKLKKTPDFIKQKLLDNKYRRQLGKLIGIELKRLRQEQYIRNPNAISLDKRIFAVCGPKYSYEKVLDYISCTKSRMINDLLKYNAAVLAYLTTQYTEPFDWVSYFSPDAQYDILRRTLLAIKWAIPTAALLQLKNVKLDRARLNKQELCAFLCTVNNNELDESIYARMFRAASKEELITANKILDKIYFLNSLRGYGRISKLYMSLELISGNTLAERANNLIATSISKRDQNIASMMTKYTGGHLDRTSYLDLNNKGMKTIQFIYIDEIIKKFGHLSNFSHLMNIRWNNYSSFHEVKVNKEKFLIVIEKLFSGESICRILGTPSSDFINKMKRYFPCQQYKIGVL